MQSLSAQEALRLALEHHQSRQWSLAETFCRQALTAEPSNPDALHLFGVLVGRKGDALAAVQLIRRAIAACPSVPFFHNSLGVALRGCGRLDEAISAYRDAIRLKEDFPEAHNNLGVALRGAGRLDEAIAAYRKALSYRPDFAGAYANLGYALRDNGCLNEGIVACRRAIQIETDLAEAHMNLGIMLLLKGDFREGWAEYEWRWRCADFGPARRSFAAPQWRGTPISGKTILLHAEQGFGDTIQFIRYAPLVARLGARPPSRPAGVVVECQRELVALVRGMDNVDSVIEAGSPLPPFDLHAPLLSLPAAFGTTLQTIPDRVPYLKPDPALVAAWRERVAGHSARLRIGLAWAGSPTRKDDRLRSLSLAALAPLGAAKDVVFFSLQKGEAARQAQSPPNGMVLADCSGDLRDFADTAALIENLDLVISVDTSVAHLAGALGKPVWNLLEFVPAWRWLLEREDSPWYPTMRLFRQTRRGDWDSVVARVAGELRKFRRRE